MCLLRIVCSHLSCCLCFCGNRLSALLAVISLEILYQCLPQKDHVLGGTACAWGEFIGELCEWCLQPAGLGMVALRGMICGARTANGLLNPGALHLPLCLKTLSTRSTGCGPVLRQWQSGCGRRRASQTWRMHPSAWQTCAAECCHAALRHSRWAQASAPVN